MQGNETSKVSSINSLHVLSFFFVSGLLKTMIWQMSKSLPGLQGCDCRLQRSLVVYHWSRKLNNYAFFPSSTLQASQQVTFFPSRFAKISWLSSLKVYPLSSHLCFSSKGESNKFQENNTGTLKKDTNSQLSDSMSKLSHIDSSGRAQMVDVGAKKDTSRIAVASAKVFLGPEAFHLVKENKIQKGDVLTVAQLAGIMASKLTANLIPLCHNISITHSKVNLELDDENFTVCITGSVNSVGKTGVEMESLTAVTIAALTVYDMCKAVSREIVISDVKLLRKSGGKSGDYLAP